MINRKTNKSILAGILVTFALISFCPTQAGFWGKAGRTLGHTVESLFGLYLIVASTVLHGDATVLFAKAMKKKAMDDADTAEAIRSLTLKRITPVVGLIGLALVVHAIHSLYKLFCNKKNHEKRNDNVDDSSDDNNDDNSDNSND